MAVATSTNIILHFTEMQKLIMVDVLEIMKTAFPGTADRIQQASLKITSVHKNRENGNEDDKQRDIIECLDFMYDNKFRVNGQQIITTKASEQYTDASVGFTFDTQQFSSFVINRNTQSIKKSEKKNKLEVYKDLGLIYTLSFDKFDNPFDFTISLQIDVLNYNDDNLESLTIYTINTDAYVDDYRCNQYDFFGKQANMINSNMESFMLLRTNPKLTGNIKLVVGSDNTLYLDTFKVSATSILNKKEYRHQEISADGNYAYDVYNTFNNVPSNEMYNVYPDSYDAHKNYYDLNLQIENIYEYGAEYNTDRLYSENMHILAPLYLGKHLPDYFVIFRTNRIMTSDYTNSNSDELKQMIKDAQQVKIVDLRKSSTIGKYIHNYKKQISEFLSGTCSLQFIEQDNDMYLAPTYKSDVDQFVQEKNPNYRQGYNTWKGLVYDKGILASKTETSYFANKILNDANPQENFDWFLMNGFQRNNLLYPNIINFDFMFNDPKAEDLSIHNYFGLYLTENNFITFNQIITDTYKGNDQVIYFDENNKQIHLSDTKIDILNNDEYKDRLFCISTMNDAMHIKNLDDVNYFIKTKAINRPYQNLLSIEGQHIVPANDEKGFISFDFTKQIKAGEHFKFITLNNYSKKFKENVVLEIIASDDKRLIECDDYIFPYIQTNTPEYTVDEEMPENTTKIYRLTFYVNDIDDNSVLAPLDEQIKRLCAAIYKFDSFIKVSSYDGETVSFISSYEKTYCQHILSDVVREDDAEKVIDPVRYFNYNNLADCYVIENIPDLYREEDLPFAVNGLELYGKRYSNIVKFIEFGDYKNNYIYEIYKDVYEELKNIPYPITATVKGYFPIIKHHVNECHVEFSNFTKHSNLVIGEEIFNSVVSPWDVKCSIIVSTNECISNNHNINICSPLSCNISLMGISQIKDIDTYTDIAELYHYQKQVMTSFEAGERVSLNNGDPRLRLFTTYQLLKGNIAGISIGSDTEFMITSDSIIYTNNIDDSEGYNIVKLTNDYIEFETYTVIQLTDIDSLENYDYETKKPSLRNSAYFINPDDEVNSNLRIPLVPMVNCQWKSTGNYFDNNSVLDVDMLKQYDIQGNFIENRYTPSGNVNNQYIVNKLDDLITVSDESVMTIKSLLKSGAYKGFIKKYLTSNYKIDTAIGHYNPNVQTLEFIFYGLTFKLKLSNAKYKNDIKLNEYNNYEIFVINNYDGSLKNELYIDKDSEFMLFINHTYCINDLYTSECVKMLSNNNDIVNSKYAWYQAPYTYELMNFAILDNNAYLYKESNKQLTSTNTKYLLELDLPIYEDTIVDYKEDPVYAYFNIQSLNSGFESLYGYDTMKTDPDYEDQYTIISQQYDYSTIEGQSEFNYNSDIRNIITLYARNHDDFEQKEYDYRQHNMYMVKYATEDLQNLDKNISNDIKLDLYANTFMCGDLDVFITSKKENDYTEFSINENYRPLTIDVTRPNKIKFNQGLFDINFVDVFDFEINDTISQEIGLDTLYGNTQIKSINSLPNYFQNKILDTDAKGVFNFFVENSRSPLSSCWDNNIYRLYSDEENYSYVPGYISGYQDKMFFGSTCLVLNSNEVTLDTWNYNEADNYADIVLNENNVNSEGTLSYEIKLNITKTFYNHIINSRFYNNWDVIDDSVNVKTYINNYINNTLINLFDFKSNILVELYKKYNPAGNKSLSNVLLNKNKSNTRVESTSAFIKQMPKDFNEYELEQSVKTELEEMNNEIILTITIAKYDNYYFYPIVKILKH